MGQQAGSTWQRLRAWNRRSGDWGNRHPWLFAGAYATTYLLTLATIYALGGMALPWWIYGLMWLALVVFGGFLRRWRVRRRMVEGDRSADLPRPGNPLDGDDGRRWRSGIG